MNDQGQPQRCRGAGTALDGLYRNLAEFVHLKNDLVSRTRIYKVLFDNLPIRSSMVFMQTFIYTRQNLGQTEALVGLREDVEHRGNMVVFTFTDDPAILGKGKYSGWRAMIDRLGEADQVVVGSSGDLPGRTVKDLLKILDLLRHHGVGLYSHRERISTDDGVAAVLDLVAAYRAAKLSEAIRAGQAKAQAAGKTLGRPAIQNRLRQRILDALANGAGVRSTARQFNVSPASVVNIRRAMTAVPDTVAA